MTRDTPDAELILKGYGLTTARMFYHLPDHPLVLNVFIWQFHDLQPDYPHLFEFIEFWQREIEGSLHSVEFSHDRPCFGGNWRNVMAMIDIATGEIRPGSPIPETFGGRNPPPSSFS